jgi:hypothetical protein
MVYPPNNIVFPYIKSGGTFLMDFDPFVLIQFKIFNAINSHGPILNLNP